MNARLRFWNHWAETRCRSVCTCQTVLRAGLNNTLRSYSELNDTELYEQLFATNFSVLRRCHAPLSMEQLDLDSGEMTRVA